MPKQFIEISLLTLLLFNVTITGAINFSRVNFQVKASPQTRIYIDPANGTAKVGDFYTISVKVDNIVNLTAFDIQLRWGTTVLKYQSHTVKVPVETFPDGVLHSPVAPIKDEVNETQVPGALPGTTCWVAYGSAGTPFDGNGTILTMTFKVLREGECDIYFTSTPKLSDPSAQPISHQADYGYLYMPGLGHVPVANFTVWPDPAIMNKTVTFNASASHDPDPGGSIALYMWNFGDGTVENTTTSVITHKYNTKTHYYYTTPMLTVLDDQGGGSQSNLTYHKIKVVLPNPVAKFTFWPGSSDNPAVVNKTVIFDASTSYDPDPDGRVIEYRWDFGDEKTENTSEPIIHHNYTSIPEGPSYTANLTVVDIEGLLSKPYLKEIYIVERRDVEVTNVTASPSELMRGEYVTINATIANRGQAEENFTVTAYYNRTATEWVRIGQVTEEEKMPKQTVPEWQLTSSKSNANNVDWILTKLGDPIGSNNDTRIKIGNDTGYWTINPGKRNVEGASTTIITSTTALSTGGWILEEELGEPKMINGSFSAGNWSFIVGLHATEINVNATVWVRVLRSNNPNPQADGAKVTVLKNWSRLFTPKTLSNITRRYQGNVSMPPTTFTNEYLYIEYQLQVTGNLASNDTEAIFQIGVPHKSTLPRAQIKATTFSYKKQYTLHCNTENVPPGSHVFMVNASKVPHETNLTNNVKYTSKIHITPHAPIARFTSTPVTPMVNEEVLFDASETYFDRFLNVTYSWDLGDGTLIVNTTDPAVTHRYTIEGNYTITLSVMDSWNQTDSTTQQITVETVYVPLDLTLDVGTIHFRGETAEFYILVSRSGGRFNASKISATLYFNGEVIENFPMENVTYVATGLYLIRYEIPMNATRAPPGTYTLVVDVSYLTEVNLNLLGTGLKSFLLSSTLTGWDALLTKIDNDTATIVIPGLRDIEANLTLINATLVGVQGTLGIIHSSLGTFMVELDNINATLSGLIVDSKGEIMAQIDTALGPVTTKLDNLNTTVTDIKGNTAIIVTNLGEVHASVGGVHSIMTIGLAATSVLSAIAAAAAVLAVLLAKKLSK